MKKYIITLTIALAGFLVSCTDFLDRFPYNFVTAEQPATMLLIENLTTGAYQVIGFDCYAAFQWMPVNMWAEVLSDNAFPGGGDANDQPQLQQAAIFNSSPTVSTPDGWWSIFFSGIQRVNTALVAIERATPETYDRYGQTTLLERRAELLTLRAFYVMWLWKAYGNIPVPFFDATGRLGEAAGTPAGADTWVTPTFVPQQTVSSVIQFMLQDLDDAIAPTTRPDGSLVFPDTRPRIGADRGRVHRAMAKMTRARILLHAHGMIGVNDAAGRPFITPEVAAMVTARMPQVLTDMQWVINRDMFGLVTETPAGPAGNAFQGIMGGATGAPADNSRVENPFLWIFLGGQPTTAGGSTTGGGEFSSESVFEHFSQTSSGTTWGNPWIGQGNYTPRFTSLRQNPDAADNRFFPGWGFVTVRPEAYAIFSQNDRRRTVSVINWAQKFADAGATYNFAEGFQNTGLWMGKQAARRGNNAGSGGDRDLNWANNRRIFRIAEAYLIIAELQVIQGITAPGGVMSAQTALDAIRDRAYGNTANRIPATPENIKLEWRREFFGEGLRFWQLLRWYDGAQLAAFLNTNNEFQQRTWPVNNRSRLLPIPESNINQTYDSPHPLVQNPGY